MEKYFKVGKFDSSKGFKVDGRYVHWKGTKAEIEEDLESIGWPKNKIEKVHTNFQVGWGIADLRFGVLTEEYFKKLQGDRNGNVKSS